MSVVKKIRGTREWAVANIDCCTGCSHDCRYCYARYDAVVKNQSVPAEKWPLPVIRHEDVTRIFPLFPGPVMFPTTHDILPEILDECITVLRGLLMAGNSVLVVSKPHLSCITPICEEFKDYREKILFRFTIPGRNNTILTFWEPGAPPYEERLASLKRAKLRGYQTSVSIEPMLESENIAAQVEELSPHTTHSIWIGKMNKISQRVDLQYPGMEKEIQRIRLGQEDQRIIEIYNTLKGNPLVRWKESIKEIVGLELLHEAGLDT